MKALLKLITLFLVIAGASLAGATTVVPINLGETVAHSRTAAEVRIDAIERVRLPEGWGERIKATILDHLAGEGENGATLEWVQFRFSELSPIAAMPTYRVGQRVVLFLPARDGDSPFQAPVGLGQGAYRVINDPDTGETLAINGQANMSLFRRMDVDRLSTVISERLAEKDGDAIPTDRLRLRLLQGEGGPISLELLKESVRAIASDKSGDPAKAFAAEETQRHPVSVVIEDEE